MTKSVTKIKCKGCHTEFYGYYEGLFNVSIEYAASCPNCNNQNFFFGPAAFIDGKTPDEAVKIMNVVKL